MYKRFIAVFEKAYIIIAILITYLVILYLKCYFRYI